MAGGARSAPAATGVPAMARTGRIDGRGRHLQFARDRVRREVPQVRQPRRELPVVPGPGREVVQQLRRHRADMRVARSLLEVTAGGRPGLLWGSRAVPRPATVRGRPRTRGRSAPPRPRPPSRAGRPRVRRVGTRRRTRDRHGGHCRELRRREDVVETREEAGGDVLGEALEDRQRSAGTRTEATQACPYS